MHGSNSQLLPGVRFNVILDDEACFFSTRKSKRTEMLHRSNLTSNSSNVHQKLVKHNLVALTSITYQTHRTCTQKTRQRLGVWLGKRVECGRGDLAGRLGVREPKTKTPRHQQMWENQINGSSWQEDHSKGFLFS